jgi:exodeoxyribonuclease VII small subunit
MTKESAGTPVAELGYAEGMEELEAIVEGLDRADVDIDLLSGRFRRAVEIVEELDRRIVDARADIDQLTPRIEALQARKGQDAGGE